MIIDALFTFALILVTLRFLYGLIKYLRKATAYTNEDMLALVDNWNWAKGFVLVDFIRFLVGSFMGSGFSIG